jgi:hypothetical protein
MWSGMSSRFHRGNRCEGWEIGAGWQPANHRVSLYSLVPVPARSPDRAMGAGQETGPERLGARSGEVS